MKTGNKLSLSIAALLILSAGVLAGPPLAQVNGGGQALLTDDIGREYPASFAIAATVTTDSSAQGHVNFVFQKPFAADWGAVPGVDLIHVWGKVTSATVAFDGTITLVGEVTEKDFSSGDGLVFLEEHVPFYIIVGGAFGPGEFILQWCLLPEFGMEVTKGTLHVR